MTITRLLEQLLDLLSKQDHQSNLEKYLSLKGVTSAADAEYWIKQYDLEQTKHEKLF